ncbi:MAG TPA: flavoprotein [Anaerohalosphaeraceae bacterium]|jgi:phosphopantothenoylcysteine synthetase/decarboxylase|nr:flavoprotein [Anaerohalosphaeraceae bacterium]HRT51799.1 flavoprotein [Anaerohalosphaeraceae bacterium]HRT87817.1 flavoprotein [Anaerohalosphaeraceae bacterium]
MADGTDSIGGLRVLLGVTGGIAAYKAVDLASKLTARGAAVDCILTRSACELVRPRSFQAVTQRPVFTKLWSRPESHSIAHINLADAADIVVVAPATANIIAKAACGICDDLLSTTLCACWNKPVLIAPAMNCRMWANPAVQRNVEALRAMNFEFVGPEAGRLACGVEGVGRMAEAVDILAAIEAIAARINKS